MIRRVALLVVVLSVSLRTASIHAEATALRTRWTAGTPVVLANRDLERGEALTAEDTSTRRIPPALVPHGALQRIPAGAVMTAPAVEGEILVGERIVTTAPDTAPPGTSSVRLEPAVPAPTLEPGDRVDVLSFTQSSFDGGVLDGGLFDEAEDEDEDGGAFDRAGSQASTGGEAADRPAAPEAEVVARAAEVLVAPAGDDTSMTVAVADDEVLRTAAATLRSGVVVVLRGR
ncbi:MAG: SAF domain-containing protein [Microthrixaceae bacterium]|nr:SAF domain-containing protein [Microthrixaceae bacterium]